MSRKLEFIVLTIFLIFVAQFIYLSSTTSAEYGGADDKPEGVIEEITGGTYKSIAEPVWEPPSAEIESLLFALQCSNRCRNNRILPWVLQSQNPLGI